MQFTIKNLLEQLQSFNPIYRKNEEIVFSLATLCFFSKTTEYNNTDFLYLGYTSQFTPKMDTLQNRILVVCIHDVSVPESLLSHQNIYLVELPEKTDFFSISNAINTFFYKDLLIKNFTEDLYQAIVQNYTIQSVCDMATKFLENPLVLLDNSLKHIAISSDVELEDNIWLDQKKNGGYITEATIDLLASLIADEKNNTDSDPIIVPKGDFNYSRIISHIFVDNQLVGTIVIFEIHRKFHSLDITFARMLSDIIALKMKNDTYVLHSKGAIYEHLFLDLLNAEIEPANLYDRLQSLNLTIEDDIYVIAIDISEFDQTYKTLQYFKNSLNEIIHEGTSILYHNYIVKIIMFETNHSLSEIQINRINEFCKKKKLFAGVSKCFHDIADLKSYFNQAVTALHLSRKLTKTHDLAFYTAFIPEHMIDIAFHNTVLKQLCNEDLLRLIEYDKINNTSFTNCLYEFLLHERNLAHTAKALHIHRNTLLYRINRIEEIMNHDLTDSNYRFNILLSFKILYYLENMVISI